MGAPLPDSTRLRFRGYSMSDEANVRDLFADPAARRFYPDMGDAARVRRWIEWNLENYRTCGYGLWALELKSSGEFVGDCGLTWQEVEGKRELEIGYHIAAAHRGRGYATEAARHSLDYAWTHTDAPLVCSIVRPSNAPSCAVARRVHERCREIMWKGSAALLFYTRRAV